jgi:hypothetical protein
MIVLTAIIYLISKLFCDWIKFKPHLFKSDWILAKGKYNWDKRNLLTKGIFSFVSDGWHLFDAIRNMSFVIAVVIALGMSWYWCIIGYAVLGGLFNLLYKIKS